MQISAVRTTHKEQEVLVEKNSSPSMPSEPLPNKYQLLICAHKKRDKRCGVLGAMLAEEFQKQIKEKGLEKDIVVSKSSHYGGHKFAGNVIVYPGIFPVVHCIRFHC
jgi:hypothetical protein